MSFTKADKAKLLMVLGGKITLHRSIKGYTINQLASKCELECNQLEEMESGKIDIRINNLLRIAYELDIEMKDLLP